MNSQTMIKCVRYSSSGGELESSSSVDVGRKGGSGAMICEHLKSDSEERVSESKAVDVASRFTVRSPFFSFFVRVD
jgi:hypothetical protein